MDWAKTTARGYKKHFSFGIWCDLNEMFDGSNVDYTVHAVVLDFKTLVKPLVCLKMFDVGLSQQHVISFPYDLVYVNVDYRGNIRLCVNVYVYVLVPCCINVHIYRTTSYGRFQLDLNTLPYIYGPFTINHCRLLTHWGREEMNNISQTTFSNAFSPMKLFEFRLKFHWNLFPRVQLTIFQHWFR